MSSSQAAPDLLGAFADVARTLLKQGDVSETLQKVVNLAVDTVEGCDHAAVSVVRGKAVRTDAATGDLPRRVDDVQYETGEGPCLDAIREHEVFRTADLATESRWPHFAARAAELGAHSMLSIRLFVESQTMGALNLYSTEIGAFERPESTQIGTVFAAHAAVAWSSARQQADMEEALRTRDLIGQAKGILMATRHVHEDEAFDQLRQASQRLNVKLRTLAEQVAYTGLPPDPPPDIS